MKSLRCARCQSKMDEGFLIDVEHGSAHVTQWASGTPAYHLFRILKMKGRRKIPVQTWRCASCGFLESYANDATA